MGLNTGGQYYAPKFEISKRIIDQDNNMKTNQNQSQELIQNFRKTFSDGMKK